MPVPQPPADLPIPKGLATQVTQLVAAVGYVLGLVQAVLAGDLTQGTIAALIIGTVSLVTLAAGRYAQAVALLRR